MEDDPFTQAEKRVKPSYQKVIDREFMYDVALFIWYYGNDTFRDGDIGYHLFVYLSKQIPALEAKTILMGMEGSMYGSSGVSSPPAKKRYKQLQNLAQYGVK
jgi:hypothetical protein